MTFRAIRGDVTKTALHLLLMTSREHQEVMSYEVIVQRLKVCASKQLDATLALGLAGLATRRSVSLNWFQMLRRPLHAHFLFMSKWQHRGRVFIWGKCWSQRFDVSLSKHLGRSPRAEK